MVVLVKQTYYVTLTFNVTLGAPLVLHKIK